MNRISRVLVNGTACILIIGFASGCSTMSSTSKSATTKTLDVYGHGVIQMPILAELEISSEKVTGQAKEEYKFSNRGGIDQAEASARQSAHTDALRKANADVLVEPQYDVVTAKEDGTTWISATVTGFPATYSNFRPITSEDIEILDRVHNFGVLQKSDKTE